MNRRRNRMTPDTTPPCFIKPVKNTNNFAESEEECSSMGSSSTMPRDESQFGKIWPLVKPEIDLTDEVSIIYDDEDEKGAELLGQQQQQSSPYNIMDLVQSLSMKAVAILEQERNLPQLEDEEEDGMRMMGMGDSCRMPRAIGNVNQTSSFCVLPPIPAAATTTLSPPMPKRMDSDMNLENLDDTAISSPPTATTGFSSPAKHPHRRASCSSTLIKKPLVLDDNSLDHHNSWHGPSSSTKCKWISCHDSSFNSLKAPEMPKRVDSTTDLMGLEKQRQQDDTQSVVSFGSSTLSILKKKLGRSSSMRSITTSGSNAKSVSFGPVEACVYEPTPRNAGLGRKYNQRIQEQFSVSQNYNCE